MFVGLVVTSLKKYSVEGLLSHDRDLKGYGFGFQQGLGPVIMFEMFPFIMLAGCRGKPAGQGLSCRKAHHLLGPRARGARPGAAAARQRGETRSRHRGHAGRLAGGVGWGRKGKERKGGAFAAFLLPETGADSPGAAASKLERGSPCGGQGQWRKMKARNLSCAWLAQQTAER